MCPSQFDEELPFRNEWQHLSYGGALLPFLFGQMNAKSLDVQYTSFYALSFSSWAVTCADISSSCSRPQFISIYCSEIEMHQRSLVSIWENLRCVLACFRCKFTLWCKNCFLGIWCNPRVPGSPTPRPHSSSQVPVWTLHFRVPESPDWRNSDGDRWTSYGAFKCKLVT